MALKRLREFGVAFAGGLAVAGMTALLACGGEPGTGAAGVGTATAQAAPAAATAAATAGVAAVQLRASAFDPATLTIKKGTTVTWGNSSSRTHTVTADGGAFKSGELSAGAAFSFTFTAAGTIPYHCEIHGGPGGQGMAGKIVVE